MIKMCKIISIIMIITVIFGLNYVNAFNIADIKIGADTFLTNAKNSNAGDPISPTIISMSSLMLGIGVIVAIITGLIIAIKTMADGSFGKAQLKESLTPYLIGCIVIFGAWGIWAAVVNLLQ